MIRKMYIKAIEMDQWRFDNNRDQYKTKKMCEKAVEAWPWSLSYVPDHFKFHEVCNEAVRMKPYILGYVSDHLKTDEMCETAAGEASCLLKQSLISTKPKKCVKKPMRHDHGV